MPQAAPRFSLNMKPRKSPISGTRQCPLNQTSAPAGNSAPGSRASQRNSAALLARSAATSAATQTKRDTRRGDPSAAWVESASSVVTSGILTPPDPRPARPPRPAGYARGVSSRNDARGRGEIPVGFARARTRYLAALRAEAGLARSTLEAYGRDLDRLARWAGQRGIPSPRELEADDLLDHLGFLRSHYAEASCARALSAVRTFLRFLVDEGELERDPARDIEGPRLARTLPRFLSVGEVELLLESARGEDWKDLRDRALLEVLYATGARVSEAVGLRTDDLAPELRDLRLYGKGGKVRVVPLGERAGDALRAWLEHGRDSLHGAMTSPFVFLSQRAKRLSRQEAWRIVKRRAYQAGIRTDLSPHALRHSFASHLVEAGAGLRSVQELLGHASIRTTERYTHTDAERVLALHRLYHPRG